MITYPVVEKFISINGEGQKAGELAAFIRMRGCNLSCNYCDTSWANTMDCPCEFLSTEELITWLTEHKIKNVTLTGGEPLLTTGIDTFIEALGSSGFSVEIETNGSVALDCFHNLLHRPAFTMDYKCPSSNMEDRMNRLNLPLLKSKDVLKFVVGSKLDLSTMLAVVNGYDINANIFVSPVFGEIDPKEIVDFLICNDVENVRIQLQLHKIIWDPNMRGV